MMDEIRAMIWFGIISALVVGLISWLCLKSNAYECRRKAAIMEMNQTFSFWEGCMIEYKPGKWIPYDKYRVVDE